MTSESLKANSIVYFRDGKKSEFRAATVELSTAKSAKGPSGNLRPRKSARAYVAVFKPGIAEGLMRELLRDIADHLKEARPPRVEAIASPGPEERVDMLPTSGIRLDACDALPIDAPASLKKTGKLPWAALVVFGVARHWKDALDDVEGLIRELKTEGLLRGHITTSWGPLELIEREGRGIFAQIKKPEMDPDFYEDDEDAYLEV
jgi:hypothetical protein